MSNIEIDLIGNQLYYLYIHIAAIKEIKKQSDDNPEIYKKYSHFFYHTYVSLWNELVLEVCKINDKNSDATRLIHLLKKHPLANKIINHPTYKNFKEIRNKASAHTNKEVFSNHNSVNEFYNTHKQTIDEVEQYTKLLVEAWEKLAKEEFAKPRYNKLIGDIRRIFEDLSKIL
jgi:hypothetical protein